MPMTQSATAPTVAASNRPLKIIGAHGSHDIVHRVLAQREPCKILDIPAGTGVLGEFLLERGWDVHAADIDPGLFKLEDVPFERVDLNRRLPHDDASFDAIACVNGLHRLFNPGGAVKELYRILRPGGTLYVNVQNYGSIRRRLRFMLYGSFDFGPSGSGGNTQTVDDPESRVRQPLAYAQLADMLVAAGFDIADVQTADVRRGDRLLTPLAWLIRAARAVLPMEPPAYHHLEQPFIRAVLPGAEYMFVEAVKPASASSASSTPLS